MNNEQTKTPGQVAFEAFDSAQDHGDHEHWYQQPSSVQVWWEASASAVISSVLQGAKWVLLEPGVMMLEGDETWSHFLWSWVPAARTRVCDADICRRPISLPSSVRPDGKSEGPASTPSVSSGDAGAGVPAVKLYPFRLEEAKKNLGNVVTAEKLPMRYVSTSNHNWFPHLFAAEGVATWAFDDNGKWDGIGNCSNLFMTTPTPIWQLPPPPTGQQWHRTDGWTKEMLPEGWRPLLDGEELNFDAGDEYGDCYKVGHEGPTQWRTFKGLLSTTSHMRTRRPLPQSAEPVAEEKPALTQYWQDTAEANLKEAGRERARAEKAESERDQLRKDLEEAQTEMAEARELMPIVRRQDYLDASLKEAVRAQLAFMNERLNYIHDLEGKVTDLTTDKAVLKDELKHASELEQNERSIRVSFENELKGLEQELTCLRSQLTWTPVPPEGITRTDEKNKLVVWVSDSTSETGIEWLHGISRRATHYISIESLRQFLPSPPETEEQTMRREFEAWARSSHELRHVSYELTGLMGNYVSSRLQDAWLGYQAAKQSTKEQA